jgi:hypothetical protein
MPKVSLLQEAFTGGEFSPLAQGQVSGERYRKGLASCLNYVPALQGPLLRRPATKFVATTAQSSALSPVFIPFIFSQTQSYMLEFGGQYISFYAQNGIYTPPSSQFYVAGSTNDGQHFFFGTRPAYTTKPGENILSVANSFNESIYRVPSPYLPQDVQHLKWGQNADTLYLTHPNYPTFKLQRFGTYDWRLAQVYFQDGPYLAYNSYAQIGDSTQVTLTPVGTNGAAGTNFFLQTGSQVVISGFANVNNIANITTQNPHGYLSGTKIVIQNCSGVLINYQLTQTYTATTNSSSPVYYSINTTGSSTLQVLGLSGSGVVYAGSPGGLIAPALFLSNADIGRVVGLQQGSVVNAGQRAFGYITSWSGLANQAGFYLDQSNSLINTSVVTFWQLGCYGGYINNGGGLPAVFNFQGASPGGALGSSSFPSATCFHQDRLCFTGSPNFPQQLDGSTVSNFENFAPSVAIGSAALQVQTNNAYQFTLNSTDENKLQWLKSTAEGLLAASFSNEWVITPGSQATSLNPTNVNAQQTSFFGSADIDAVMAGNAVLYVQRALRKVREMNYFFQIGTYRSSDLTILAEHITLPTITKLVVQKETQPLVWGLTSNGQLVSMTYNRDDVTVEAGWSRHQLGGRSDSSGSPPVVTSMATIPDPTNTYDQLWLVTKRFLNSSTVNYCIEYMTNFYNDSMIQAQAFQGDCGASFDSPISITTVVNSGIYTIFNFTPQFQTPPPTSYTVGFQNIIGLNSSAINANGVVSAVNPLNGNKFQAFSTSTSAFYLANLQGSPVSLINNSAYVGSGVFRECVTSVTGAWWLTGETVNVLADGANTTPVVVGSGGTVALPFSTAIAQVGYAFNSRGQLMRAGVGSNQGSAIGSTRRMHRAAFQLHDVGDFSFGMNLNNLLSWNFMQADNLPADTAEPLYSGIIREGIEAEYNFDNMLWFQQNSMLPGSVISITTFYEETDV